MEKKSTTPYKLHPTQLISVSVAELFIKANRPPDLTSEIDEKKFSLSVGHSEYDEELQLIHVGVVLEIGMEETGPDYDSPFSMRIEVLGDFKISDKSLSAEHIYAWVRTNAALILYPYLREQAFALTSRCGFRPIILPLLEVPTLVIER